MRAEKELISKEYIERLNSSPFFIVVDYRGLTVTHFKELRKRLRGVEAEIHVVKNNIFAIAAKEAGIENLNGDLAGQSAVVTGLKDISATAKVVKGFHKEFEKPQVKFGFMEQSKLSANDVLAIADLPSLDELRGGMVGTISGPATKLVRLLSTPGTQLARVMKARSEQSE